MSKQHHQISAVVFDWAGTIVDFGSCAPMGAFVRLFEAFNIELSIAHARIPMGMAKRDHIQTLLALPQVSQQWQSVYGRVWNEQDIDELYDAFIPMNAEVLPEYADVIPDVLEVVRELKNRNIKIGSTTGYNRALMDILIPLAAQQGYEPDSIMCADDTVSGRPAPLMMYKTFAELGVWYPETVVKVDDTEVGIQEGLNAGCWTVGVLASGNEVGLSLREWQALSAEHQLELMSKASAKLKAAGAHFVVATVAEMMPVLHEIEERLQKRQRPIA